MEEYGSFRERFPPMRESGASGKLRVEESRYLMRREEGRPGFDWPTTKDLFVLYVRGSFPFQFWERQTC